MLTNTPRHLASQAFRIVSALVVIAAACHTLAARADALASAASFTPGPYEVGCSNFSQDFSRVLPGESAEQYWQGFPTGNQPRYVVNLMTERDRAFYLSVMIPRDDDLYGKYAGSAIDLVTLVCYPTPSDNPRLDYPLPNGKSIPHMQRMGETALFPDGSRYPILLFSHGLAGSPLSDDYLAAIKIFASHGYVVLAPFHGDPRVADVKIENLNDLSYALSHLKDFIAMQAVRPLAMRAMLDAFLTMPEWQAHVDANRVGAFGASLGGESVMLMGGASLTTTIGLSSKPVVFDMRLKAAVGYVPYFGQSIYPAFGRDQRGLDSVFLPYLAISGTGDTTAPIEPVRDGMERLSSTRELVALQGVEHGFNTAFSDDIFTWALAFLDGQLSGSPAARAASARMTNVAGGGDDRLERDYIAPSKAAANERIAVEFYNPSLDHYFFTTEPDEAAMLDAGVIVPGWFRTGFDFKVYPAGDSRAPSACRFFGTPGIGPNSHFFTTDSAECAKVKNNPFWTFEGLAFSVDAPTNADCAADRVPVIRMYNNGKGGQANHRYLTSHSEIGDMLGEGWIVEGPVFCAVP